MRSLGFFLRETIDGIRLHGTGSVVTFLQVFISLFFLGMSMLVITNINHFVDGFLSNLEIKAFLMDEVSYEDSMELMATIESFPGVADTIYISKEEAFGIMQERTPIDISDLVNANPLPASIKVTVNTPGKVDELGGIIGSLNGVEDVRYGDQQLETILKALYAAELFSFLLAIFIAFVTMLTIGNTIRLAILARRNEILIMQHVGATGWFIRIPFMLEGLFYGFTGSFIALVVIALVYNLILTVYNRTNNYNPLMIDFTLMMNNLSIMLLLVGVMIGVISSLIAVGRHLEEDLYRPRQTEEVNA